MIGPSGTVRILVATKPVDFRKGADGLAALVRDTMGADPFSGAVYVFRAKRADRVKLVFWDGTGVVLVAKRLEDGEFCSKVWTGAACMRHDRHPSPWSPADRMRPSLRAIAAPVEA
jgi:hypothetical protein